MLAPDLRPMAMPEAGLILSEALAEALEVRPGEQVTVDFLEGAPHYGQPAGQRPFAGLCRSWGGDGDRSAEPGHGRGCADFGRQPADRRKARDSFFAAAKGTPKTGFVTVTALTVARFRQTLAENITVMITVYVALATIIAVGVVYNFARIALSEQGRELASLRVLGFTRAEVSGILFGELAAVVVLAQPLGWLIGYVHRPGHGRGLFVGSLPRAFRHRARGLCDGQSGRPVPLPLSRPGRSGHGSTASTWSRF